LIFLFAACEKEDTPVQLPPPGELQMMTARMGINYDTMVFVSLKSGFTVSHFNRNYDLAFESSAEGWRIYLNSAQLMMAGSKPQFDLSTADTTGLLWKPDDASLLDDSLAIGKWCNDAGLNSKGVIFIDRGKPFFTGSDRFRKMMIEEVNSNQYRIRFSKLNNTGLTDFIIPKNIAYSFVYFSFDNNGEIKTLAPPRNEWDFVFTRYTHTYYNEPLNSPFRYYLVSGALLNKWNGSMNELVKKDSTAGYISFEEATYPAIAGLPLSSRADAVGFDWKYFDFNTSMYYIRPDQWYLLKNFESIYYKLRFIDFYDEAGNKGAARFEYQRI
jgi:hypothetical protein